MILDALILIGSLILYIVSFILGSINYIVPQQAFDAIHYWLGFLDYLGGIMPIQDVKLALGMVLTIFGLKILIKAVMFGISFIPGIHPHKIVK